MNRNIFEDLFVLELANNHWGNIERGLKIITDYSRVVRFNNVRAAIKFQLRDVESIIHKDFRHRTDIRYIKKTIDTHLPRQAFEQLVAAVRESSCVTMATPFDEKSVEFCEELGIQIIKIASYDINDWILIERIARTKKPVIVSTGGTSLKDIDDIVTFFENRNILLAINHCVSLYPTEKDELELNQIDFLKKRYPEHIIGLSTHEVNDDLTHSMLIAYAKGARTFERHIDIENTAQSVTPYCSLPEDIDHWFKAYHLAKSMCGQAASQKRNPHKSEINYLDALVRGVYAKTDLPVGHQLSGQDVYFAIPLQKGQISCREFMTGEFLLQAVSADQPVFIEDIDSPYAKSEDLKRLILNRGL